MGQMQPDQGNRYELAGLIAKIEVLAACEALHPDVGLVPLAAAGLGLVPLTDTLLTDGLLAALPQGGARAAGMTTGPESGFSRLTPALLALLERLSNEGHVAYLEAEYTGRDGAQTAAVWRDGVVVLGPLILGRSETFVPRHAPISHALRLLGVTGERYRDEFVVAGLGRYRRTVDWTPEEWDGRGGPE